MPDNPEDCPNIEKHTASPSQYNAYIEWCEKMSNTHDQFECAYCGFYVIWIEKYDSA